jgi:hypothetical protein
MQKTKHKKGKLKVLTEKQGKKTYQKVYRRKYHTLTAKENEEEKHTNKVK